MNRRLITTPDLHDAVGAALRCWDVETVEACPWLQMAAMTGASLIAGLLCRHAPPLEFSGSSDVEGTLVNGLVTDQTVTDQQYSVDAEQNPNGQA